MAYQEEINHRKQPQTSESFQILTAHCSESPLLKHWAVTDKVFFHYKKWSKPLCSLWYNFAKYNNTGSGANNRHRTRGQIIKKDCKWIINENISK